MLVGLKVRPNMTLNVSAAAATAVPTSAQAPYEVRKKIPKNIMTERKMWLKEDPSPRMAAGPAEAAGGKTATT